MSEKNIFAKIISGEVEAKVIAQNDHAICIEDLHPQAKLHYLVIPRYCYQSIIDFHGNASSEMIEGFWNLASRVSPSNGKCVANFGNYAEIPHFHMHLMSDDA